jgi:hypothetical protein
VNFWYHLSAAGFIPESFHVYDPSDVTQVAGIVSPVAKLTGGDHTFAANTGWSIHAVISFSNGGPTFSNSFVLGHYAPVVHADEIPGYYVQDLYAIDTKIDDGLPDSGTVRAWDTSGDGIYQAVTVGDPAVDCVDDSASPVVYTLQATIPLCSVVVQSQF